MAEDSNGFVCNKCNQYYHDLEDKGTCYGNYVDCYHDLCNSCNPVFDVAKDDSVCFIHLKKIVQNMGYDLVKK
jgi:hypothetical protein